MFAWDAGKEAINLAKHGVAFDEAATIFDDPYFMIFEDPDHSLGEYRYLIVGQSAKLRLLVVSYTDRGETTRIISAREATKRERRSYEEKN